MASLRTRTAHSATVVATSPSAVAVTIGLVPEQLLGAVEDVWQGQRSVLHESAHGDSFVVWPLLLCPGSRPYRWLPGATTGSHTPPCRVGGRRPLAASATVQLRPSDVTDEPLGSAS